MFFSRSILCTKIKTYFYFTRTGVGVRGFSFVELIVTAAIMSLVFSGLFTSVQLMLQIVGKSKAQAGAVALTVDKMEYIRSLPYNAIGTVLGVPSGSIPQTSTTSMNGIEYSERVLIQYIDDPSDGIGGADSNAILNDYKQVKIEYTWELHNRTDSVTLVSNIVPPGIETTVGGGTIRVNVFDASVLPLAGAEVRFVNNTTTTTIDTLRYTDITGVAYLSGAPAAANYEITVTDTGYSTDGTYTATTSNPSPTTQPVAVLESQVSTMNFQIDALSDLLVTTVEPATYASFTDSFADTSRIADLATTSVYSGAIVLLNNSGTYEASGTVRSATTSPSLASWYELTFTASTSSSTDARVFVLYEESGVLQLVPDVDLPGNSGGFSMSSLDISNLDTGVYHTLALQAALSTSDTNFSPQVLEWSLSHITTQPVIGGVQLSLNGEKTIGIDALLKPIYKYTASGVSDGSGQWEQNNIEWDVYDLRVDSAGYSVNEVCPTLPYALNPGVSEEIQITLGAAVLDSLRVSVVEIDGSPISNATVHLENTGVDVTQNTSLCGQAYFSTGLYNDTDYLLTVSAPGYTTEIVASTTVSAESSVAVTLN